MSTLSSLIGDGGIVVGAVGILATKGFQLIKVNKYSSGRKTTPTEDLKSQEDKDDLTSKLSYNIMLDPENYKRAYEKMKSNPGNMTPGVDGQTIDGMSNEKINKIIGAMKDRSFKFNPSKRIYINKSNGNKRPLGIPSFTDKLVQEVLREKLEEIFEKKFSESSYGFRPNRDCKKAVWSIAHWTGVSWIIEGDIKSYFDNIDHKILAKLLEPYLDANLMRLYWKLVNAGYIEKDNRIINSITGVPQGGILSPLLSNIYLNLLDKYIEKLIKEYHIPNKKLHSEESNNIRKEIRRLQYKLEKHPYVKSNKTDSKTELEYREIKKELSKAIKKRNKVRIHTQLQELYYVRYADDFLIGVKGRLKIAKEIRELISKYLKDRLNIELNMDKTKISDPTKTPVYFLGFKIQTTARKQVEGKKQKGKKGSLSFTPWRKVRICVPTLKLWEKMKEKGFRNEKRPIHKPEWINLTHQEIIIRYNYVIRGLLNYYSNTHDIYNIRSILYVLRFSAFSTLANKLNLNTGKVISKFGWLMKDPETGYKLYLPEHEVNEKTLNYMYVTAKKKNKKKNEGEGITDPFAITKWNIRTHSAYLLDQPCKICNSTENVEMHHVKHIKTINIKLDDFTKSMAKLNRKQIPVCIKCHDKIHSGTYDGTALNKI